MKLSFVDQIQLRDKECLTRVNATNREGRVVYAYVVAEMGKLKTLQSAIEKGQRVDLHAYGAVLATGYGEPSEDLQETLVEEFSS